MKKYLFIIPVLLIIYFCTLDYQEEFDNNLLSQDSINNSKELENKELENSSKPVKVSYNGENLNAHELENLLQYLLSKKLENKEEYGKNLRL